jgi:hypothetical protein
LSCKKSDYLPETLKVDLESLLWGGAPVRVQILPGEEAKGVETRKRKK